MMNWASIASSAIGAVSGLLGNIGSSRRSRKQFQLAQQENEKARSWQEKMSSQQNTWNIEQWNRENDYNTPSAQMQRFRAAGLNPNLIAGGLQSLAASSPIAASAGSTFPTDTSMLGPSTNPSSWQSLAQGIHLANVMADTKVKKTEAAKNESFTQGSDIDNFYKALHHEQDLKIGDTTISLNVGNLKLSEVQAEYALENIKNLVQSRDKIRHEITLINSQLSTMEQDRREQLLNNAIDRALKDSSLSKVDAETKKILSDYNLQQAQFNSLVEIAVKQSLGLDYTNELSRLSAAEKGCYEKYFEPLADTSSSIQLGRNFITDRSLDLARSNNRFTGVLKYVQEYVFGRRY